jgi:hypothetical protein
MVYPGVSISSFNPIPDKYEMSSQYDMVEVIGNCPMCGEEHRSEDCDPGWYFTCRCGYQLTWIDPKYMAPYLQLVTGDL